MAKSPCGCNDQNTIVSSPCPDLCRHTYDVKCVIVNKALSCIETRSGLTLEVVLTTMDRKICTIEDSFQEQIIDLEADVSALQACPEWVDITGFLHGWESAELAGYHKPQYSLVNNCTIKLRGCLQNDDYDSGTVDLFQLPFSLEAFKARSFATNVSIDGTPDLIPCQVIVIDAGAGVYVSKIGNIAGGTIVRCLSLDGIFFEIDN